MVLVKESEDTVFFSLKKFYADVRVYDWPSGRIVAEFQIEKPVSNVALSMDGRAVATAGRTGVVWADLEKPKEPARYIYSEATDQVAFGPAGDIFIATTTEILRTTPGSGSDRQVVKKHDDYYHTRHGRPSRLVVSPDGTMVAVGNDDGKDDQDVLVYRISDGEEIFLAWGNATGQRINNWAPVNAECLEIRGRDELIVSSNSTDLRDPDDSSNRVRIDMGASNRVVRILQTALSPDGTTLAVLQEEEAADYSGPNSTVLRIRQLDSDAPSAVKVIEGLSDSVLALEFAGNNRLVAIDAAGTGYQFQRDEADWKPLRRASWMPPTSESWRQALDSTLKSPPSGRQRTSEHRFFANVLTTQFAPDGRTLAVRLEDGSVKLIDMSSESLRKDNNIRHPGILMMEFSPDSKTLTTLTQHAAIDWRVSDGRKMDEFTWNAPWRADFCSLSEGGQYAALTGFQGTRVVRDFAGEADNELVFDPQYYVYDLWKKQLLSTFTPRAQTPLKLAHISSADKSVFLTSIDQVEFHRWEFSAARPQDPVALHSYPGPKSLPLAKLRRVTADDGKVLLGTTGESGSIAGVYRSTIDTPAARLCQPFLAAAQQPWFGEASAVCMAADRKGNRIAFSIAWVYRQLERLRDPHRGITTSVQERQVIHSLLEWDPSANTVREIESEVREYIPDPGLGFRDLAVSDDLQHVAMAEATTLRLWGPAEKVTDAGSTPEKATPDQAAVVPSRDSYWRETLPEQPVSQNRKKPHNTAASTPTPEKLRTPEPVARSFAGRWKSNSGYVYELEQDADGSIKGIYWRSDPQRRNQISARLQEDSFRYLFDSGRGEAVWTFDGNDAASIKWRIIKPRRFGWRYDRATRDK